MPEFAAFEAKLAGVQRELSGEAARDRLKRVAKATEADIAEAVRGDLGDTSMSGWRRGNPIEIVGTSKVTSDTTAVVSPGKATGPMRVLEQGRNRGNASGFAGPGVNRKTGETARTKSGGLRKVRAVKARRWNGVTDGKGTWSDATKLMEERVPKRFEREVAKSLGKFLTRG